MSLECSFSEIDSVSCSDTIFPSIVEIEDFIPVSEKLYSGPSIDLSRLLYISRTMDRAVSSLNERMSVTENQLSLSIALLYSLKHRKIHFPKQEKKVNCYFCGEKGHFKRHCQKRQQSSYQGVRY